jgi:outer membrane autotransporter protein
VPAVFKAMPKGMLLKAPAFEPRWRAWAAGFDGAWSLQGEAAPGSADLTHRSAGGAAGVDYQVAPDLLVGAAAGGSASTFSVPDRSTSGTLDGAHAGAYAVARRDGWYTAASVGFAAFSNKTSRTIAGVGPTETATASFNSNLLSGRLELGLEHRIGGFAVTPFAAVQFAQLWQAGFSESSTTAAGGPGVLGLTVPSRSVSSLPTFAGLQVDNRMALANGMIWTPYARVAWVHEFDPSRAISASFITLPGASFMVDGPRAARDAARIDAGSKLAISRSVSLFGSLDGELSARSQMYAGKGGVQVDW